MNYAVSNGLVVLTHDLDFGALLAERRLVGPSAIQLRGNEVLPDAIGKSVIAAIQTSAAYLNAGALVTVDVVRHRVRILPIR